MDKKSVNSEEYIRQLNRRVCVPSNPLENNKVKVFYGEPSQGLMDIIAVDNRKDFMFELSEYAHHGNFQFLTGTTGRMLITFARETMSNEAINLNCDYVLFIDDDMIVPRKLFPALFRHVDRADIIAPLCFQRVHPYKPVLYKIKSKRNDMGNLVLDDVDHWMDYPPNSVCYPDAVGFGVVLIKTKVLKKLNRPWFFSNTSLGEDIFFCVRARESGFKILADTSIKVGHLGIPKPITELDYLYANKKKLTSLQKKTLTASTDAIPLDKESKDVTAKEVKDVNDVRDQDVTAVVDSGLHE